jgi:hypothetical protein
MIPSSLDGTPRWFWARRGRPQPAPKRRARLELEPLEERALMITGTWTAVVAPPAATGTMLLLPNGNVMAQGGGGDTVSKAWYQLAPNSSGNYTSGTWTTLASMSTPRLYFATNVLSSGQVFLVGGEYSGNAGRQNFTNTSETYTISTNRWASNHSFPLRQFGDDPSEVLSNGTILCGYLGGTQTYEFNQTTNTWIQEASKLNSDQSDEEFWVKLPNGNILSYNIFSSLNTGTVEAQFYNQSTNTWTDTGTLPAQLSSSAVGDELGPAIQLPNGLTLQIGGNGNTALYNYQTNTWSAGPTIPNSQAADDAPAAILPDGQVIFAADNPLFNAPTNLYDYDYVSNSITQLTGLPSALASNLAGTPSFPTRMLVLPNGHLLLSSGNYSSNQLWDFAPSDSAQTSWQPTITSIATVSTTQYTLTGTQLNGISEGAGYGDDAEMSSNYPIIKLVSSTGTVTYATSSSWSSTGISAVGNTTSETVTFTIPSSLAAGTYTVYAIANGIASAGFSFGIAKPTGVAAPAAQDSSIVAVEARSANSLTPSLFDSERNITGAPSTVGGAAGLPGGSGFLFATTSFIATPSAGQTAGAETAHLSSAGSNSGLADSGHSSTLLDGGGVNENATDSAAIDAVFVAGNF